MKSNHIQVSVHITGLSRMDVDVSLTAAIPTAAPVAQSASDPILGTPVSHPGVGCEHMHGPHDLHRMNHMAARCSACGLAVHFYTHGHIIEASMKCSRCAQPMDIRLQHYDS